MFRVRVEQRLVLVLLSGIATFGVGIAGQGEARPGPDARIVSAAFSPDGRSLVSLSSDRTVRFWDVASGKERKRVVLASGKDEVPKQVSYTPDGDVAILLYRYQGFAFDTARGTATQGTIPACLWNLTSGNRSPFIRIGYGGVAVCPKGRLLAYGGGLWEVATGNKVRAFALPDGLVYDIAFSPDGKALAYRICESLAQDGALVVVLDVATGKRMFQVGEFDWDRYKLSPFVSAPKFSPDGSTIAFSEPDQPALHLWDVAAGKAVHRIPLAQHEEVVGFSSDGKTLVSWQRAGGRIRLWDAATGKQRRAIKVENGVRSILLAPDGRTAAVTKDGGLEFRALGE
jgi:WD40 repeat protein